MNTFNLIWNYNAQVVNQNNYYDQNACKEPDANTDNEHELPKELQSNRARGMLDRAVERELLKEGYQPHDNVKKWQLALLADAIATELELKSKWKVFGRLWGIPSESLRSEATRYKNPEEEKKFQKILQRLIG
jgi:hypothetical protein